MRHLKLFEEYNIDKFEIILDSIVEVMDHFRITYYEEDDNSGWDPPEDEPYYEYSWNYNGAIRQINISNLQMSDFEPNEIVESIEKIKSKLELRSGTRLKIEYSPLEDLITIKPKESNQKNLTESFIEDLEIDDRKLYKKVSKDDILRLVYDGEIKISKPTELEIKRLSQFGLNKDFIIGETFASLVYSRGNWVYKLNDDWWLATVNNRYCYLCDTMEGLINCPITK